MNNILLFSDLHITQSSLKECTLILEEIGMLANKYNCDTLINLGDTFDNLKPSSQELDIFATFIKRLNNKQHIILAADSHESTTQEESIINHFGILNEMVTVVKEFKDENHLYCGHFSIKESISNYDAKRSKEEFTDYQYVFLGHIHSYELIKPNIVHLGSCRYVNFDEAKDQQKIVVIISDYNTEREKVHFMKLKSPIPMISLQLGKLEEKKPILPIDNDVQGQDKSKENGILGVKQPILRSLAEVIILLDKTDPNTKVKVKITDFESFREFLPLCSKYSTKFETFKYQTDFEIVSANNQKLGLNEITSFKESFQKWLGQQKIDPKIVEILKKEIEED